MGSLRDVEGRREGGRGEGRRGTRSKGKESDSDAKLLPNRLNR